MRHKWLKLLMYIILSSAATAGAEESQKDICVEVQERFHSGTLNEIIRSSTPKNYDISVLIDLDNDGEDEEFQYFIAGNHVFLWDIVNGEKHQPFMSGIQDAQHWHKASIVELNQKFYLLFNIGNSYFVLQEVTQYSLEEEQEEQTKSKIPPPYYHYKYICNPTNLELHPFLQ